MGIISLLRGHDGWNDFIQVHLYMKELHCFFSISSKQLTREMLIQGISGSLWNV